MAQRLDEIGFGGLKLYQDPDAFCYGVDAVLLADFAKALEGDNCLELGSGNGAASFILYGKYKPASVLGLELQSDMVKLSAESSQLNGLSDKVKFICGDVKNIRELIPGDSFSLVISNPPYFELGRGNKSEGDALFFARHEISAGLEDFISAAKYALKNKGRFVMVHRPSRLPDIMELLRKYGLEPKRLRMVAPYPGQAANIVLISCVKGGGKELIIEPELYVRNSDGSYSDELNKIYCR